MSGFVKLTAVGRLGQDPENKEVGDTSVTNFSIAVSEKYKDQEHTEWLNMEAWGKLGELCAQYLKKGSNVFVEAKPKTQTWEQDGQKKSKVVYRVLTVQFLDPKSDS